MQQFLIYEGKVAVVMTVFFLFFRVFLSKESLHRLNRVVLICTVIASFLIPFCIITIHKTVPAPVTSPAAPVINTTDMLPQMNAASIDAAVPGPGIDWWMIAAVLYFAGIIAMLLRVTVDVVRLINLISSGEHHEDISGNTIVVLDNDIAPFSWMHFIFLSREDYENRNNHIMEHERAHIRLGHARELLCVELLSSMQWFNPSMWYLKSDLKAIYEYEADNAVLRNGADIKDYQYSLVRKALLQSGYSITNSFNHSILKNRISMMSRPKESSLRWTRCIYVLPLLCVALALNARTVIDYEKPENTAALPDNHVNVDVRIEEGETSVYVEGEKTSMENLGEKVESLIDSSEPSFIILSGEAAANMGVMSDIKEGLRDVNADNIKYSESIQPEVTQYKEVARTLEEVYVTVYGTGEPKEGSASKQVKKRPELPATAEIPIPFEDLTKTPAFDGSNDYSFSFWVNQRTTYPDEMRSAGIQGRLTAQFKVNSDGKVSDIVVLGEGDSHFIEEIQGVISKSPVWTPGEKDGIPVATTYTLPFTFSIR